MTNPWDKQCKGGRIYLLHSFRSFSPWSLGPVTVGLSWGRASCQRGHSEAELLTSWLPGSKKGQTLQSHIPQWLTSSNQAPSCTVPPPPNRLPKLWLHQQIKPIDEGETLMYQSAPRSPTHECCLHLGPSLQYVNQFGGALHSQMIWLATEN
jgi:hypothetical protein